MSETPTPETDSVTRSAEETPWTPWVCAGHAKRLERERDEARRDLAAAEELHRRRFSTMKGEFNEAMKQRDEARRELQVLLDSMAVRPMNNGALVYDLKEHILCLERKLKEAKQMFDQLKLERMREEVTAQQDPEAQVCVYCGDALKKIKQEEASETL